MYYFTKLIVKGFGLHISKTIEFKPGVNVIVGESERGKTTLIRALFLLIRNEPRGGEKLYQSDLTDDPLYIELHDNLKNIFKRTKNKYYLNGKKLSAFGTNVPDPIKNILGFKEINWQRQITDKPFMLYNTGGAAAKELNKITGLEDQEKLIEELKDRISERKANIKRIVINNNEHKKTIERLKNVVRFKMNCLGILNRKEYLNKIVLATQNLKAISDELISIRSRRMLNTQIVDKFSVQVGKIVKGKGVIKVYDEKIDDLGSIIHQLERIPKFDRATIIEHGTDLQKIAALKQNSDQLTESINLLYTMIKKIEGLKTLYRKAEQEVNEINKELNTIFTELGYCPLCNRPIDEGDDHQC